MDKEDRACTEHQLLRAPRAAEPPRRRDATGQRGRFLRDAEPCKGVLLVGSKRDVLEHDQSRLRLCVDAVEDGNLRHLLLFVALVDTMCVYPDGRTNTDQVTVDFDRPRHEL